MTEKSAQFLIRASSELRKLILERARSEGISANALCLKLLKQGLVAPFDPNHRGLPTDLGNTLLTELTGFIENELVARFDRTLIGVVLFGSAARGSMTERSDIDLLIVLSTDTPLDRDIYDGFPEKSVGGHEVSPLIVALPLSGQELRSVWLEAAIEGIVLFDPQLLITRLLSGVRVRIAEGRIRRLMAYGVPYWVNEESETRRVTP